MLASVWIALPEIRLVAEMMPAEIAGCVAPKPTPTAEPTAPPPPTASPEGLATPGPDGPTKARDLVAVAGRRQATPSENGRSGLAIGLLALTGLIAVSGAGLVVLRIRRDTTA